jgi:hypothetical protein
VLLQLVLDERGHVDRLAWAGSFIPSLAQKAENCRTASR